MTMTKQAEYGVILAEELTKNYRKGYLSLKEIAARRHLAHPFLRKTAYLMQKNKLIKGEEGLYGGYRLKRNPKRLTLEDVLDAVEEPMVEAACCAVNGKKRCERGLKCPKESVMHKVQRAVKETYGKITFDKLALGEISCALIWKGKE